MSDFLSGFSEKKEPKKGSDERAPEKVEAVKKEVKAVKVEVKPVKEAVVEEVVETEKVVVDDKPLPTTKMSDADSLEQEHKYLRDEPTELDPGYKKKQMKMRILIGVGAVVFLIIAATSYYFMSTVKVPDFANKEISEVRNWSKENRVELELESAFSNEFDTNIVLTQETAVGKRIKKGSALKLSISKGSDPDEVIGLMPFEGSNETTIYEWLEKSHVNNLKVTRIYHDTIANGNFIRIELLNKDQKPEDFKRKDAGTIYISKGTESFDKTIVMLDFKGKTKGDVEAFHTSNKFVNPFVYEEVYSDTVEMGMIVSQSISKDEKLAINDVVTIEVSKGKAMVVPDYSATTVDTFENVNPNGLNIKPGEKFSSSVAYGSFLSQSADAGLDVTKDPNFNMTVYYSVGKPYIDTLVGKKEGDLAKYFFDFNAKGANVTYVVQYAPRCLDKGTVAEA
ncbi:MAG: PASTA domain-containing protein, partial [Erysipelothrix sp.]|nr:PASTA domain-containing protein [Erysipelothrix sp.]